MRSGAPGEPVDGGREERESRLRRLTVVALAVLVAGAAGLRLFKLGEPPLDFHPTRQFRSALLAHRFYLEARPSTPEWRLALARRDAPPIYEPPLQEWLVSLAYRIVGRETLTIPRLLSIATWLLGGLLLWPLARRFGGTAGAFASVAFFLFAPFGVQASRAFQPDPLMITLMLAGVLALARCAELPSRGRCWAVALAVAVAVLVKPMAGFQLGAGTVAVAVWLRRGGRRADSRALALALTAGLVPAAAFYGRSWLTGGSASNLAEQSFMPHLLLGLDFWRGWLAQVWKVTGFLAVAVAALGTALLAASWRRWLLTGLWAGYLGFAVSFTYQAFTHDYYHLQLVPLVALGLAAPVGWLARTVGPPLAALGRFGTVVPVLVLAAAVLDAATASIDHLRTLRLGGEAETYREVGELVGHSEETIYLANFYGYPLLYYGDIAGRYWPHWFDFRLDGLLGKTPETAAQRLARLTEGGAARYFVVTNLGEFAAQTDLQRLLDAAYRVRARTDRYVIYDLRSPAGASSGR